jgi:ABC-type sugar transport system substrate-binding protein
VVACQNDPMGLGALQALRRLGRERGKPEWARVPVLGVDGLPAEGQRLVDERTLAATVVVPPSAGAAVDVVARAWQSGAAAPPTLVLEPRPYPG